MADSGIRLTKWPVRVERPRPARSTPAETEGLSAITQEFKPGVHPGVDIAVPGALKSAAAIVVAAADGVVEEAYQAANGFTVVLRHGEPGGEWYTAYLHMLIPKGWLNPMGQPFPKGWSCRAGSPLGTMGADPTDPQGVVHLHFQLGVGGGRTPVDPAPYLEGLTRT